MPKVSSSYGQQVTSFDYRTLSGPILKSPALSSAAESVLIDTTTAIGTAPNAIINYYVANQSVVLFTTNAGANWTVNFAGSTATPLNGFLNVGQAVTVALITTQGATPYYNNAITIDGTAITPKYQGGLAWTSGNASSNDLYVYTIIKTGNAAYRVFAAQTQFK